MNNEIKYLYIDDRKDSKNAILSLCEKDKLVIDVIQPPQNIKDAISLLKRKKYDGLIVDQQLDEKELDNGEKNTYLGGALAMDIRAKEYYDNMKNKDNSIPIVLYSANTNLPQMLYGYGDSIYDLILSIKAVKTFREFKKLVPVYQKQLESLVKGYNILKAASSKDAVSKTVSSKDTLSEDTVLKDKLSKDPLFKLLINSLKCPNLSIIDSRFFDELQRRKSLTVHIKASFILNELIIHQGILISEEILAVRLGIDKETSKDGWQEVLSSLKAFGADYQGIFCEGWPRWWMPMVEKWWADFLGEESYLQFLSASDRTSIISRKLNIQLKAASAKSPFSDEDTYWTLCNYSNEPLAINNGIMLPGQDSLYPWQDAKYVSIMSAIKQSLDVADFDNERLESYKQLLKQPNNDNRQR